MKNRRKTANAVISLVFFLLSLVAVYVYFGRHLTVSFALTAILIFMIYFTDPRFADICPDPSIDSPKISDLDLKDRCSPDGLVSHYAEGIIAPAHTYFVLRKRINELSENDISYILIPFIAIIFAEECINTLFPPLAKKTHILYFFIAMLIIAGLFFLIRIVAKQLARISPYEKGPVPMSYYDVEYFANCTVTDEAWYNLRALYKHFEYLAGIYPAVYFRSSFRSGLYFIFIFFLLLGAWSRI